MPKIMTAKEAIAEYIKDGMTIVTNGFVGGVFPEELAMALQAQYLETGSPKNLKLIYAAGQGDSGERQLNHLGEEGLVETVIGGHWSLSPRLQKLALATKFAA